MLKITKKVAKRLKNTIFAQLCMNLHDKSNKRWSLKQAFPGSINENSLSVEPKHPERLFCPEN
jgi:hypothetical protein